MCKFPIFGWLGIDLCQPDQPLQQFAALMCGAETGLQRTAARMNEVKRRRRHKVNVGSFQHFSYVRGIKANSFANRCAPPSQRADSQFRSRTIT
jgi:hypothetical protein